MADGPVSLSRRFLLRSGWNEVVWKVVLPVVAVVLVGATALGVFLPSAMQSAAIESAYRANLQIAEQMKITRGYYTRNVVAKAVASGSLQPSYEHQGSATAIPLPATFVKDIADLLKEKDITLALVSPYPWPHRAERKMDAFQSMAWEVFQKDPTAALSRQEARDGKRVLRVAVPDRMTGETCVACHNSDPQSAKKDWKVGDVRAVMEVTKVVEPYLAAADRRSAGILAAIAAATILVVALLLGVTSLVVRRSRESVHALQQHNQALREHEEELSERNRQFDAALSNMADGLCMFDADLRIIDCNDRYRELFKLPAHVARPGAGLREVLTYSVGAGRHPGRTVDELMAERLAATAKGEPATLRTRLDGERTIEIVYRPMQGGGWVATHEDITEREQAEEALAEQNRRFDAALNNMPHGLCMFDASRRLIVCNRKYAEMYRLPHELTRPGTALEQIFEYRVETGQAPLDVDAFLQAQDRRARERKSSCYKLELHDGRMLQIEFEPMSDGGWVATHQDITEATRAEEQVHYLARHDPLTELPNRVVFREQLDDALKRVPRGESVAVLCIDLDQFKDVNDTLGHPVGDALLQAVAQRLNGCVRETDTVARLGGDEFAIIQTVGDQPTGATSLAARIIHELSGPFVLAGHQLMTGASLGIAIAPQDGSSADQLLKNSDLALYLAKADGRGIYRFFEPAMDARMQARRALELDLRKAVDENQFELFYQPVIDLAEQRIVAFEALMRWNHPRRGIVAPGEFIPLAEEIGLIVPMGAWALKQACKEAASWSVPIKVSVNLSPSQFKGNALVLTVISALASSGLPASRLELEITENVMLHDTEGTLKTLSHLRELGVSIAMDDFGTGYSSLSYLRKFPFDKIKIDQSFIQGLSGGEESLAIIRAVTGLSRSLGMITTAEGVETADQLRLLRIEGCTEVQGFLFSPPVPSGEIAKLFKSVDRKFKAA